MVHPLVGLAVGVVLGVVNGRLAFVLAAAVLLLVRRVSRGGLNRGRPVVLALVVGLVVGGLRGEFHAPAMSIDARGFRESADQPFRGTVAGPVRRRGDRFDVTLNAVVLQPFGSNWTELPGLIRLSLPDGPVARRLAEGHRIAGWTRLRPLRSTPNPGVRDPTSLMLRQGIVATGWPTGPPRIVGGTLVAPWRDQLRAAYRRFTERALPTEQARLLQAVVLGDGAAPADVTREPWRASGLSHLLAISGLHVGVVALAVFGLVGRAAARVGPWADRFSPVVPAGLAAITATWLYIMVAGAPLSSVRAGLMITTITLARTFARRSGPGGAILLALVVVILHDPLSPLGPAFQLSFAAVSSLVVVMPVVQRKVAALVFPIPFDGLRAVSERLLGAAAGSLICTLATAPVTAWHFQTIPLAAVAANIVAIPLFSFGVVVPALIALYCIATLSHVPTALAWVLHGTCTVVTTVADRAASWLPPLSLPGWSPISALALGLGCFGLLVALRVRRARPWLVAGFVLLVTSGAARVAGPSGPSDELRMTFLAVGHGDSVVIQFPNGEVMLVDGGGDVSGHIDVGQRVLLPALSALGVDRIDMLVLSHPHPDHFLGLTTVVKSVDIGEFWTTGEPSGMPEYAELRRVLDELGVPIRILGAEPLTEMHGDVRLSLLHPQPPGGRSFYPHLEANDNSLVLKVIYRDFSLLLTGDVEAAAEKMLVERRFGSLKSTVLKVPHHGSSTSSSESFLRAVGPTLAVAQCADRGRFAFPKPEVEARYRRLGIPLWITGRHGALQISTDGGRFIRRDWF